MEADSALRDGAQLGRYRVLRRIGSGGMATVYEAEHGDLEKRVALKTLHPALTLDPEARARFLREGRAAARIRHPNVVEVFDVGQEGDTLYLVMEHLAGEDLGTLLGREGSLGVERLVDLLLPVIAAVMTAHEAGVVHRDLKPENIFLARARNGTTVPKVLDFGISKLSGVGAGPRLTGSAAMLGTPVYMSPEQARSGHVDARSDQYALGVILYECATGVLPFQAPELYPCSTPSCRATTARPVRCAPTCPRRSRP
ncbi:MAG: serine/threonine-protein kinase [Polyangiales bacterium]